MSLELQAPAEQNFFNSNKSIHQTKLATANVGQLLWMIEMKKKIESETDYKFCGQLCVFFFLYSYYKHVDTFSKLNQTKFKIKKNMCFEIVLQPISVHFVQTK